MRNIRVIPWFLLLILVSIQLGTLGCVSQKKSVEEYLSEGTSLYDARDFIGAAELFTSAILVYPDDHRLYYNAAIAYANNRSFIESEKILSDLVTLAPMHTSYLKALVQVSLELENVQRAIELCEKIVAIDPFDLPTLQTLLSLYKIRQLYEKGYEVALNAISLGIYEKAILSYAAEFEILGNFGDGHSFTILKEALYP